MIFQDPFASLNPRMTVGQIIGEPLLQLRHRRGHGARGPRRRAAATRRPAAAMRWSAIRTPSPAASASASASPAPSRSTRSSSSPTRRPRRSTSRCAPRSSTCCSTSARSLDLSFIFISHDISVIRYFCDRVAVMHRGRIVEIGETEQVCDDPQHPYTRSLISAVPKPDPRQRGSDPAASATNRKRAVEGHDRQGRMRARYQGRVGRMPGLVRATSSLYWVDIYRPALNCFDAATGKNRTWTLPEPIGSFALCAEETRCLSRSNPASTATISRPRR